MSYRLAGPALEQIEAFVTAIAAHAPAAAERFASELFDAFDAYSRRPAAFRVVCEENGYQVRRGFHPRLRYYAFTYIIHEEEMIVTSVYHGAMSDRERLVRLLSGLGDVADEGSER